VKHADAGSVVLQLDPAGIRQRIVTVRGRGYKLVAV